MTSRQINRCAQNYSLLRLNPRQTVGVMGQWYAKMLSRHFRGYPVRISFSVETNGFENDVLHSVTIRGKAIQGSDHLRSRLEQGRAGWKLSGNAQRKSRPNIAWYR